MIRIILIGILVILIIIMYYKLSYTIIDLKTNLIHKDNQYQSLKNKYNYMLKSKNNNTNNIYIYTGSLSAKQGIINSNTLIRLAPIDDSILINHIKEKTEVKIIDEVECNSSTWFYIFIPNIGKINSKGWIKKSDFSLIESNNKNIIIND